MTDEERRLARDARVRAHLCLFRECERPTDGKWVMCKRHHSAGGSTLNYWRVRRTQSHT